MQSLFEADVAEQIIERINGIGADTKPKWGKMNAAQMMAHCRAPFRVYFGEARSGRGIMGILFGKMAKKKLFSNKPWPQSLPTDKSFIIKGERHFQEERDKLVEDIRRFTNEGYHVTSSNHPFFGKMSSQEWALLAYKHLDHHLQQFGA
jgi:hypothetical protein